MLSPYHSRDSRTVWNVVWKIVENYKVAALISIHGDPPPLCRFYITTRHMDPAWTQNTRWYHFMTRWPRWHHFTFNSCCHALSQWWGSRVPINILVTTWKCSMSNPIRLNPPIESYVTLVDLWRFKYLKLSSSDKRYIVDQYIVYLIYLAHTCRASDVSCVIYAID